LLLRIVAGVTLAAHDYPKLFGGPGKRPQTRVARAMGPNYPAAFAVAVNMGVASYMAHWKNGFYGQGGYEFSLLLGTAALSLALTGPGRLSIDHLISSK
jgi:uncharacterized membrane protein YphA (DoxX/SURF4 family)